MIKTIKIGNRDVTLKSSAALPHLYRRKFNRDIFVDISKWQNNAKKGTNELDPDSLEMFEGMLYCMAKQGDPTIPEDPYEWMDSFELFDLAPAFQEVITMWSDNQTTTTKLKKSRDQSTGK